MTTWRTILSFETGVLQRMLNFAYHVDWEGWKQEFIRGDAKAIPIVMMNKKTVPYQSDIVIYVAHTPYQDFEEFKIDTYTQYSDPPGMPVNIFYDVVDRVYSVYHDYAEQYDLDLTAEWSGQHPTYDSFVDLVLALKT